MKVIAARELRRGQSIVLAVNIKGKDGKVRSVKPNQVEDTDRVISIAKSVMVKELVHGECGKGLHVNERRIRNNERSPHENGRLITSDGCYDYAARILITEGQ